MKVNASKENAKSALEYAQYAVDELGISFAHRGEFLVTFLKAAIRKLPHEKSYKRDKSRRSSRKKKLAIRAALSRSALQASRPF